MYYGVIFDKDAVNKFKMIESENREDLFKQGCTVFEEYENVLKLENIRK